MARSPFTLAALATAAVSEFTITGVCTHSTTGVDDFDAALVNEHDGSIYIVRVPNSAAAEREQNADLVALNALSIGARSRLPFDVPQYRGQSPTGDTRALVYTFLRGHHVQAAHIEAGSGLDTSCGRAIAGIHSLPHNVVTDAGLPHRSPSECRRESSDIVESATATHLLPITLRERWRDAVADDALWQFQPTVINGSLTVDSLLVAGNEVTAILGWSQLSVGDPAQDLHWLLSLSSDASQNALREYTNSRKVAADQSLTQRAHLYSELGVARWLLHGRALRDSSIVDDAVTMLDTLVDAARNSLLNPLTSAISPTLALDDVEDLLDHTPGETETAPGAGFAPVSDNDTVPLLDDETDSDPDATPTLKVDF